MRVLLVALSMTIAGATPGLAQPTSVHAGHGQTAQGQPPTSPYAGLETRAVAGLSENDMASLRRGEGWGLALAAELNGVPGPSHALDMREALGLDPGQVAALQAIRDAMRAEAVVAGERLIAAEAALDLAFKTSRPGEAHLRTLVQEIGAARTALQLVHLLRHLSTPALLTPEQVARYATLRGYSRGN